MASLGLAITMDVKVFIAIDNFDSKSILVMLDCTHNGVKYIWPNEYPYLVKSEQWEKEKDIKIEAFKNSILAQS
jgi:hypothetical protein